MPLRATLTKLVAAGSHSGAPAPGSSPSPLPLTPPCPQELLRGGGGWRGYLTRGGRGDPDKLCWLFTRLAEEEEQTFQQREVGSVGGR